MTDGRRRRSAFARAAQRRGGRLVAGVLAVVGLALTAFAVHAVSTAERDRARARFDRAADAVEAGVRAQGDRQRAALRALTGLFAASTKVERAEFDAFVENLDPAHTQPGVRAITYVERVARDDLAPWLARVRAGGAPDFAVRPAGPDVLAPDLFVCTYVHPATPNAALLGLDVGALRAARTALEQARDEGDTTLSPPVPDAATPTVVFYRPVYRNGAAATTTEERRAALVGWVAAVVEVAPFMADLLAAREQGTDVELFDGTPGAETAVLLDADGHLDGATVAEIDARYAGRPHVRVGTARMADRRWTVRTSASPGWEASQATSLRWVVLGLGAAMSVLVGLVVTAATRTRRLAERLADRATGHLERQARELAQARDEAMAGARAKSDFLAAVSHEIRTPLNGVLGTSQLLLDAGMPVEQGEQVRTIRSSAQALLAILNDILDVSRIEAGRLELAREPFDLREAVEEVLDLLVPAAAEKHLELVLRWAPGCPSTFVGDPLRWKQILLNLAGNALKFTDRGHVLVDVRPAAGAAAGIEMRVEDTGVGIAPDRLSRLFRRFSQADPSSARRQGGVGLGLLITRLLVERMGGTVDVTSTPGVGTVFRVVVPMERSASTIQRMPRPPTEAPVLVVDDAEPARRVACELVAALGHPTTPAADAAAARAAIAAAAARGAPFALVMVDLGLPDEDGLALGRGLAADPATAPIRRVLVAAAARARLAEDAQAAGFDAWIGKPLRARDVADTLSLLLSAPRTPGAPCVTHAGLADARRRRSGLAPEPTPAATGPRRVLLIEDLEINARVATKMLQRLGCTVEWARGGQEGIDAAARGGFDLVLLDLRMPDVDGFQVAAEIRRREADGPRVPIVTITADVTDEVRAACLASGMDDFLGKPVEMSALAATVERWCRVRLGPPASPPPP